MQNPLALRAMAWCRPPAMLTPCCAAEVQTARAAASVAPATMADASCMPGNTGSSAVPSPCISSTRLVSPCLPGAWGSGPPASRTRPM